MKVFLLVTLFFTPLAAFGQSAESIPNEDSLLRDARSSVPILLRILLPPGLREGYTLREYFASDAYVQASLGESDQERMDAIYYDAVELTHQHSSTTLLAAAFSVFEHKSIQLQMPGFILPIPLTSESNEHFDLRVSHLPAHIYSPKIGDVDKLQHFFSSAWLKKLFGMDWLVEFAGNFVEVGEQAFVVGGADDPRDKHANADGLNFGRNISRHIRRHGELDIAPSEFLTPNP